MTNHIHDIEINNFKSIRHQKIEDCRRVNVFVGYPNVGKSNILEGLSLISYLNYFSLAVSFKKLCRFKELIDIFNDGDKKKTSQISADGFLFSLEYISRNEIEFSIKDLRVNEREIKITGPESAAGIIKSIDSRYSIDKGGAIRSISSTASSPYSKPALKKYSFVHSDFSSQWDVNSLAYPSGENLGEVLRHNGKLRKESGELFATYDLRLIFDENENIVIQKQLDEFSAFQFSFSQIADTLQRLIFHKAAIATNENTILLFEEPEAHMFPPYISKFTTDVMYDKNNNQYFIATHSPFVLNDFMEDMNKEELAIYAVGYEKGETIIKRLTDKQITEIYQYGVDLFFNLEDYLKDVVS